MKKIFYTIIGITITLLAILGTTTSKKQVSPLKQSVAMEGKGFAVMELFTSQGCSSCPPADEILGNYAKQNDDRIIPLSFHVDYWNRLGWTDSFSRSEYTKRQNEYASKFDLGSIYTPQLIINGQKELVGSDDEKISGLVATALKEVPVMNIRILKTNITGNKIIVEYEVNKSMQNLTVNAALVQDKAVTQIRAGENRGVKLINYNVVRDFAAAKLPGTTGTSTLQLPPGNNAAGYHVVLFLQQDDSGKIIAVVRSTL